MDSYRKQQMKVIGWFDEDLNDRKRSVKKSVSHKAKAAFKRETRKLIDEALTA